MKYTHTKVIGKGGIRCSCCQRAGSKKACRVVLNRRNRRENKIALSSLTSDV